MTKLEKKLKKKKWYEHCGSPWPHGPHEHPHEDHHPDDHAFPDERLRHHFQFHERRRRWHEKMRRYTGAHLRRRLFLWFGASIFITLALAGGLSGLRGEGNRGWLSVLLPALILWIISGKVARRIARPLDELVHVSTEIGRGNLAARAGRACGGLDEIAVLARSINHMAGRIERQIADQRELLAGVSHELRTPLARLRVLLDIGRERGAAPATWDELERELLEMDHLVGELLASARLDFQALVPRPLDAVDAAARALERAGLPADKLVAQEPTAPFAGDPTLVGRALANLLHNAARHGGGVDQLRVKRAAGRVRFEVLDRGPGFAPELLEKLFRPFVQGDPGAPAGEGESPAGTSLGLGLALVARIARAHGGTVQASNRREGGAQLVLELAETPPQREPTQRSARET
jgi:two-component system, OmpR family, sensor kinase